MTRRLFGLPGSRAERSEVVARIALPSLREGTAVLLRSPSAGLRAAAALSPILSGDPRSAPALRELAQHGRIADSVALLARNPGAPSDVSGICSRACDAAEQEGHEWWHSRAWLAGLSGLAHLGRPEAIFRAGTALCAWQGSRGDRRLETNSIDAVLLAVAAMGTRLRAFAPFCRRLEALSELPHAAFPLAAAGDRRALHQLAEHPETAPLLFAFDAASAGEALVRSLTISDAGLHALTMLMARGQGEKACRALVEQAAAQIISGDGNELAALIVEQGISLLTMGWRVPLLHACNPVAVRLPVLAALASTSGTGAEAALAVMLSHSTEPSWAARIPPLLPGVDGVLRMHCDQICRESPAFHRARRTQILLSLPQPPAALVDAQLRYGSKEAIAAAIRLPEAVVLLSRALKRRRIWRSDAAVYRFRCAFAASARGGPSAILRVLASDPDLRVSMLAEEALQGVPVSAPVDHACPGTHGWLQDFQSQGYSRLGSASAEAG